MTTDGTTTEAIESTEGTGEGAGSGVESDDSTIAGGTVNDAEQPNTESAGEQDAQEHAEAAGEEGGTGDESAQDGPNADESVEYDLQLPEGAMIGADVVEQITDFAKENGVSPEAAQKFIDMQDQAVRGYHDSLLQQHTAERKSWAESVKSHAELGGANFEQTCSDAQRAIAQFGTDELKEALNQTGFGNHPLFVSFAAKIGRAMAEDSFVQGQSVGGGDDPYAAMYPNTKV